MTRLEYGFMLVTMKNAEYSLIELSGADAKNFLNGLVSADVDQLCKHGCSASRAFVLDAHGKINFQIFVISQKAALSLLVSKTEAQALYDFLDRYIIADDVSLCLTKNLYFLNLQIVKEQESLPAKSKWSCEFLSPLSVLDKSFVFKARLLDSLFLELSFSLDVPDALFDLESLRLEYGLPLIGVDIKKGDFPFYYPLADAFSFDKGCFMGQEVMSKATFRGNPPKVWTKFVLSEPVSNLRELFLDDGTKTADVLESCGNIALGFMKRHDLWEQKILEVYSEQRVKARVVPLFSPKHYRGER